MSRTNVSQKMSTLRAHSNSLAWNIQFVCLLFRDDSTGLIILVGTELETDASDVTGVGLFFVVMVVDMRLGNLPVPWESVIMLRPIP